VPHNKPLDPKEGQAGDAEPLLDDDQSRRRLDLGPMGQRSAQNAKLEGGAHICCANNLALRAGQLWGQHRRHGRLGARETKPFEAVFDSALATKFSLREA
jgi:hypothetical protein